MRRHKKRGFTHYAPVGGKVILLLLTSDKGYEGAPTPSGSDKPVYINVSSG